MKNYILLFVFVAAFCSRVCAQQEKLFLISTSIEMEPYTTGYVNALGDTIIPIGKYVYCFTPVFDKVAFVLPKSVRYYCAIDRNEKILFQVQSLDNTPDPVRDGLFRIVVDDKLGVANMDGEVVIEPKYTSTMPFRDGYSAVCIGGTVERLAEFTQVVGGKWGIIDTSGCLVVDMIYDRVTVVDANKAKVLSNGTWKEISLK